MAMCVRSVDTSGATAASSSDGNRQSLRCAILTASHLALMLRDELRSFTCVCDSLTMDHLGSPPESLRCQVEAGLRDPAGPNGDTTYILRICARQTFHPPNHPTRESEYSLKAKLNSAAGIKISTRRDLRVCLL